jgi:hypothetical protein
VEEDAPIESDLPPEVAAAEEICNNATHDLKLYKCIPPGMKGVELLNHMIKFGQRTHKDKPEKYGVMSCYLNLEPRSTVQHALLSLDFHQITMKTIMDDMDRWAFYGEQQFNLV